MASGRADYYFPDIDLTAMLAKMDDNITALGVISTNLGTANTALDLVATKLDTVATKLDTVATKLSIGADLVNTLDGLDGTVDGLLTLGELNTSNVVTELQSAIVELVLTVAELVGVHADTTELITIGEADTSGPVSLVSWTLVSDVNVRRISIIITNDGAYPCWYSRDGGTTQHGTIEVLGQASFFDSGGIWMQSKNTGVSNFAAHEEWAT